MAPLVAGGTGWVALVDGAYAGHLLAWTFGEGSTASSFAPEEGLAVAPGLPPMVARRVVEELVAAAARAWVAGGIRNHVVNVPVDEAVVRDALTWLGYGMFVVNALRGLDDASMAALPAGAPAGVHVRRADPDDLAAVLLLDRGLRRHLVDAPTFLVLPDPQDPDEIASLLADPGTATFLAEDAGMPVAFLRVAVPGNDVATLVKDAGTLSITGAFTRADHRGGGVAAALVGVAAAWARERGHVRLGVDFESANILASRFWTRWFTPVVDAYVRRLPGAAGSPAASPDPEDLAGTGAP